ncbi:MAG: bifunctional oligoribonuclease/PAP phosphatase NrnA [Candidatus Eisenbacteria bacterium]|nr:bifunctional oligoribonuclease/PAP phosphatase NrnA [Candidatus Eisenbacteria bacterium]
MTNRTKTAEAHTAAAEALSGSGPFVITSHRRPDGDALGSSLALLQWLRARGAQAVCVNSDGVPEPYPFLPLSDQVLRNVPDGLTARTAIVVDTPDVARAAIEDGVLDQADTVVNIDHHPDNACFGNINLVDVSASSAALLVWELLAGLPHPAGSPLHPGIAAALYVGTMTDTGCFRFRNTDARTMKACAEMVALGAEPSGLATAVYGEQPAGRLRLLGLIIAGIETVFDGRVALSTLTDEMRRLAGDSGEAIEGIASYGRLIRGVEVSVLLREEKGGIRASLRSAGSVDVNDVARRLGGGGHKAASGVMLSGDTIQTARGRILAAVKATLEDD